MAIEIDGTKITMTRGDTLRTQVTIYDKDAEDEYTIQDGDSVRFAMRPAGLNARKTAFRYDVCLTVDIPTDTLLLEIEPEDTAELDFGAYTYDIQLTQADGTVDTFIANATLILSPEVD